MVQLSFIKTACINSMKKVQQVAKFSRNKNLLTGKTNVTQRQERQHASRFYCRTGFATKVAAILALSSSGLFFGHYASAFYDTNSQNRTQNHTLVLEMTPAMCLFYPSRTQMRQCQEGYRVTVEALDLGYNCVSSTRPVLSPVQEKVVHRIMPDDTFIRQAWRRYGECSPYNASEYFRLVTRYTSELKLPAELTQNGQYLVDKNVFKQKLKRLNPNKGINKITFDCQQAGQSILTKIEICYADDNRNFCSKTVDSCPQQITIWGNNG